MVNRSISAFLVAAALVMLMGCQSEIVPAKGDHPPTDPSQVKIYQDQPKKYEILAPIEVAVGGDVKWDDKGEANAGFEKFKSKAAAHGANGVLLTSDSPDMLQVIAGYDGKFYRVPLRSGTAMAKAIYVWKE